MDRTPDDAGSSNREQRDLIDAAWMQVGSARDTTVDMSAGARRQLPDRLRSQLTTPPMDSFPGYRVVEQIQRGGQGIVLKALQVSTGREVAIKVMREGPLATDDERSRFEREVRILAQLKHPNIVSIFHSDVADGHFYYVMDYIAGRPLDEYFTATESNVPDTLRLFGRICDAVAAAHLRGVIHRDLKPGNIRVDDAGQPHVLDFGLSKVIDAPDTSSMTLTGQFVGTVPWASPEQAAGHAGDIDIRTDVYSLGVLLYQMLTGVFPYEVRGRPRDVLDNVISAEPIRPRSLRSGIPADVETIVIKCLQKDRERRYQSAGELGRDVERFLRGEPIAARRDSLSYVLRKQLARHKVSASVGAAFAVLFVVGFATSLTFWRQAEIARESESKQKDTAQAAAAEARAVSDFLTEMLAAVDPFSGEGRDVKVVDVLAEADRRIASGELADQPALEGAVRRAVGRTYASLHIVEPAEAHLRAALAALEQEYGRGSAAAAACMTDLATVLRSTEHFDEAESLLRAALTSQRALQPEQRAELATTLNELAGLLRDQSKLDEAEKCFDEALSIRREIHGGGDHEDIARTLNDMALLHGARGDLAESGRLLREALAMSRRIHGAADANAAVNMSNLAGLMARQHDLDGADAMYADALAAARDSLGDDHATTVRIKANYAVLCWQLQRFDQAETLMREAVAWRRKNLGDEDPSVGTGLNNLAVMAYNRGDYETASNYYADAIEILRKTRDETHESVLVAQSNLAAILRMRGQYEEAERVLRDVIDKRQRTLGERHEDTLTARMNLALTRYEAGERESLEAEVRDLLNVQREVLGDVHPDVARSLACLGRLLSDLGRLDEADPPIRESLAICREKLGPDHTEVASALATLADLLVKQENYEQAESAAREALAVSEKSLPEGHWQVATYRANVGAVLIKLGHFDEAETELLTAYERLSKMPTGGEPYVRKTVELLRDLYDAWDRPTERDAWAAKLATD